MTPQRVVVLGGTGLIGGPAVRALLHAGHEVSVVTRGARAVAPGAHALVADRGDAEALAGVLAHQRFDLVLDLLAYDAADVRRLFDVPGLRMGRYVMISTGQVYLVSAQGRPPFREPDAAIPAMPEPVPETREHANWTYGMGKRAAERAAGECGSSRGTVTTALRLPVVQGAHDASRRLWAYLQRLRDGGPLLLPEGGHHPVRFVWAEDVARAVAAIVAGAPVRAPAYNLAQPDEPALAEFVAEAAALLGVSARIVSCRWEQLAPAGLDHNVSPFSGPWCSRPDPTLAASDWGFAGTPSGGWLEAVVRAHLEERDPQPHPGYAHRDAERALAHTLAVHRG